MKVPCHRRKAGAFAAPALGNRDGSQVNALFEDLRFYTPIGCVELRTFALRAIVGEVRWWSALETTPPFDIFVRFGGLCHGNRPSFDMIFSIWWCSHPSFLALGLGNPGLFSCFASSEVEINLKGRRTSYRSARSSTPTPSSVENKSHTRKETKSCTKSGFTTLATSLLRF